MDLINIQDPSFLKKLTIKELENLSEDIRDFLIKNVSKTGGHFSSNLGIVELTVALHYVFNSPKDYFIFDVGHQAYVHKILTGRAKDFSSLRQYNGLSGFQKRHESVHDHWEAGHSSTAISGAVGMAIARDLNQQNHEIIAIVGDAALMSGESLEALNHLGSLKNKVIIILNDNNMSIGKNVGGLSIFLNEVRRSSKYKNAKNNYASILTKTKLGEKIYKCTRSIKESIKKTVLAESMFSEFGVDYIGPVDGHNYNDLISALQMAKEMDHSVVLHVHTKKGKGYLHAENDKSGIYHGVSPFDYHVGIIKNEKTNKISWSKIISDHIQFLMRRDKDIVVITPAMINGSQLNQCFLQFPNRCFDVGIAEEHAMTFTAGLSMEKKKPYLTIYSSFIQRAYDQLNHDIARMDLPCLIGIDRSGLVGEDGDTHHGVFDIGLFTGLPNVIIMTPKDGLEAMKMINTAMRNFDHPYLIRFPKGEVDMVATHSLETLEVGKWEYVIENNQSIVTVITYDNKVELAKNLIEEKQLPVSLINARFIKPIDCEMLNHLVSKNQYLLIYETDMLTGGLGSLISQYYHQNHHYVEMNCMGLDDSYVPHGKINELLKLKKLDKDSLYLKIKEILDEKGKN
ncbi:MAG: 1-deoxy-D-xylulose-5-phosphate synthase [Bacilli bacterium]|nr:1-deoxy-D-xylulose-5-phosphate synthase [Bacilli bacterium]